MFGLQARQQKGCCKVTIHCAIIMLTLYIFVDGIDREWSHWVHWWFDFDRGSYEIIPLTIQHPTFIPCHHWGGITHTMMRRQKKTSMMQMNNKSSVDEHLDFEQHVQDIVRRSDHFSISCMGQRRLSWILCFHDMSFVFSTSMILTFSDKVHKMELQKSLRLAISAWIRVANWYWGTGVLFSLLYMELVSFGRDAITQFKFIDLSKFSWGTNTDEYMGSTFTRHRQSGS